MALKYCPKCGTKTYDNAKFCVNCGLAFDAYVDETDNLEKKTELPSVDEVKQQSTQIVEQNEAVDSKTLIKESAFVLEKDSNEDFEKDINPKQETKDEEPTAISSLVENTEPIDDDVMMMSSSTVKEELFDLDTDDEEVVMYSQSIEPNDKEVGIDELDKIKATDAGLPLPQPKMMLSFKTMLLCFVLSVAGIIGVLSIKLSTSENKQQTNEQTEEVSKSDAEENNAVDDANANAGKKSSSTFIMPEQSGSLKEVAFHVIVSSVKDKDAAKKLATKYNGYVIESDNNGYHKIAVYRSLKKDEAYLYVDSVVKKNGGSAWVFEGKAIN